MKYFLDGKFYEVEVSDAASKTVWCHCFKSFPTFEDVRHALEGCKHGRAITAWRIFRHFRATWRPMNPAASEAIFGGDHGTVHIVKYNLCD